MSSNSVHPKKAAAKKAQLARKPRAMPSGISAAELERRLKQREAALARRFAAASSPQVASVLRGQSTTLRGAREVLASLIDPANSPPVRLPGGGKPTFVNKLHYTVAGSFNYTAGLLVPNSGFAIVRRDPRCFLIYSYWVTSSLAAQSSTYGLLNSLSQAVFPLDAQGYIIASVADYVAGFQTHGAYMLPWQFADGANRFWFQNESANLSIISMTGLPFSTSCVLSVNFQFNGVTFEITITQTSSASGTAAFTLPTVNYQGYVKLRVATTNAPATWLQPATVSMADNSTMKVRHMALPSLWTNFQDIDSIRVNSMSLLASDRTAEQFTQGDIVAYQASGGDVWEKCLGATGPTTQNMDPYTTVATYNDSYEGKYLKGRYMPAKLTDDPREMNLIDISDAEDPWEIPPIVFSEQLNYVFIGINTGVLAANASSSPMVKYNAYCHVEGETESQWRETQVPKVHPDAYKEAKWAFSQVECNFENPSHLKKIWDWVRNNAPRILDAVDLGAQIVPPQLRAGIHTGTTLGRGMMKLLG